MIAAEDSLSAERLTAYLTSLQFQVQQFRIPMDGQWEPPTDAIAICGPKSSPVTATAIEADPFLTFAPDPSGRWTIRDKATGVELISPLDQGSDSEDLAYVGRLPYRGDTLMIIAGVHALGSLGAVDYLANHAAEIYAAVETQRFSFVARSTFDGMNPTSHQLAAPVRSHD